MPFAPLPATACWQHRGARSGFEVSYFQAGPGGWRLDGTTTAVEDSQTWIVTYSIQLDAAWLTREARGPRAGARRLHSRARPRRRTAGANVCAAAG